MTRKGYTLLEMLVTLFIVASLSAIFLGRFDSPSLEHYYFMNEVAHRQSEAILNKEKVYLDHSISFNAMGHVEIPRTIDFGRHKVIVHLGSGYATIVQ